MNGIPGDVRRDLPLAAVAAATTWLTMVSWRGFTSDWGAYMAPLILVAMAVAGTGVALRAAPLSRRTGATLHVLVIALLVWLILGGSVFHPVASSEAISLRIQDAWISAETWQPPIPTTQPSIAPLMIPCGALALLLVDLLACWLRRVPLAGLPLLAVYCVPISVIGHGVSAIVFLIGAAGFLLMIFLQESAHVARWGRPLGSGKADPTGFGVSTGASRGTAATVGGISVLLAVVLPLFIPTLHLDGFGMFGPGGSGGDKIHLTNPVVKMNRDLFLPNDVPLLDITTDDPDPSYLRIAALTKFDGSEWSSGTRAVVSNQVADGLLPPEPGLSRSVPINNYNYTVKATQDFDSLWLPTVFPASSVDAPGAWHYDTSTMDFLNSEEQTTAGLSWTMTAAKPELSAYSMINSLTAPTSVQSAYVALPDTTPSSVRDLARKVTRGADSRFEAAKMLQTYFRAPGNFTYSLQRHRNDGDGNRALLHFLFGKASEGGHAGYCQQFASAYAVMARELGIPARVAVGFLEPTRTGRHQWQYSAHDMHAWPELYFQGSGWVRFEPTPATRPGGTEAPAYTTQSVQKPSDGPSNLASAGGRKTDGPSQAASANRKPSGAQGSSGWSIPWLAIVETLAAVAVGIGLALVPRTLRRRRRAQRLAGGAEDAWAELRDSAIDLGVAWPYGRSPHETGHRLAAWFGHEPDGPPPIRPPRGRGLNPAAEHSLDQVVHTLERTRYARTADDVPGALAEHVETCIAALAHGSSRSAIRRAEWWPRSLVSRGRGAAARRRAEQAPEATSVGGVIDHVG
jgi:transglutaminase-like putative cysteine protease